MADGERHLSGGILGLRVDLLVHSGRREAIHYDLFRAGRSLDDLGSEALTWLDLKVFATFVQQDHSSALGRELHGPTWSIEAQLLAEVTDALNMANWQRGGKRSAPRPKPVPRPWLTPKSTNLGSDPIPISAFDDWWDGVGKQK